MENQWKSMIFAGKSIVLMPWCTVGVAVNHSKVNYIDFPGLIMLFYDDMIVSMLLFWCKKKYFNVGFLTIWNSDLVLEIVMFWVNFYRISYYNHTSWLWPIFLTYYQKSYGEIFDSEILKFSNFLKTSKMMSLGQGSMREWLHSLPDSKYLHQTMFFHAKPMKNIAFS